MGDSGGVPLPSPPPGPPDELYEYRPPESLTGVFWFSTATAFLLAFTIGANDVANNFGTSVGSGAVSMRMAIVVAAVAEVLGAVTLGSGVSDTIVRGISDLDSSSCWDCQGDGSAISLFMLGMASSLASGALFLLGATWLGMPVSTTHAVVGAVIGMTLVGAGPSCVLWGWPGLASISASWVLSPALAGLLSGGVLLLLRSRFLLGSGAPLEAALAFMSPLGGGTLAMFSALLLLKASPTKHWPLWAVFLVSMAVFAVGWAATHFLAVPRVRRSCRPGPLLRSVGMAPLRRGGSAGSDISKGACPPAPSEDLTGTPEGSGRDYEAVEKECEDLALASTARERKHPSTAAEEVQLQEGEEEVLDGDHPAEQHCEAAAAEKVFMYLQILTACLKSYAHGANDTANAAGPYTAVQALYIHGAGDCSHVQTPFWVLVAGGAGIVLGLSTLGHKVMKTIGSGLTDINFSRGFAIELGSTVAVVLASIMGMPVSSTHCQVGAIVAVGLMEAGPSSVNWGLFSKIAVSWLVTVPAAAGMSAALLWASLGFIRA